MSKEFFRKFQTQWNETWEPDYEVNEKPSMTVPDQTMSIKEILERHARGLSFEDGKVPMYEGEDNPTPDLDRMELTDRMDLLQANADKVKDLYDKHKAEEKSALESSLKDSWVKEYMSKDKNQPTTQTAEKPV